ncbi:MAG: hypothetical protein PHH82_03635 [Candidatus ainarchaeum sp.]|nr:hypothetical protein [Candidatus ainarchaeum sp.]
MAKKKITKKEVKKKVLKKVPTTKKTNPKIKPKKSQTKSKPVFNEIKLALAISKKMVEKLDVPRIEEVR